MIEEFITVAVTIAGVNASAISIVASMALSSIGHSPEDGMLSLSVELSMFGSLFGTPSSSFGNVSSISERSKGDGIFIFCVMHAWGV